MAKFHDADPAIVRRRLAEIAEAEAARRPVLLRSICGILASVAVSLLIMAWGFSMDDDHLGPTIFFGGALVGNLGVLMTLLWAYRASED